MPRPRSLSDAQLAAAGLAVVDRDGLTGLSMRAVASELGVGTMSLYRYVTDREQLERLMIAHVLADVDPSIPGGSWRDQILGIAGRIRAAVGRHGGIAPLFLAHRQSSPAAQRCGEAMLDALARAGLEGAERAIALRAILAYLTGSIAEQQLGPLAGPGTDMLAGLPREEFPHLVETAVVARGISPDDEFFGGLRLLLEGVGR